MARKRQSKTSVTSQAVIVISVIGEKDIRILSYGSDKCETNEAVQIADAMVDIFREINKAKDAPFKEVD